MNELRKCTKCEKTQDIEQFQWARRTTYPYRYSFCRSCRKTQTKKQLSTSIEVYLKHRTRRLKYQCNREKINFNLTYEYLLELFNNQNGKCFYTGSDMEWRQGKGFSRNMMSVDKVIPEKGYTVGNVVLCIFKANSVKSNLTLEELREWIPAWYQKLVKEKLCV